MRKKKRLREREEGGSRTTAGLVAYMKREECVAVTLTMEKITTDRRGVTRTKERVLQNHCGVMPY